MREMKQMPYRVTEGAIERAKYRAKMAVREAAHPVETTSRRVQWRWASAMAMVAVVVMGVVGFVKYYDSIVEPSPMDRLVAQMQCAPDELINEWAVDAGYYLEDVNSL
jgi:anti-sigma-K factor RskA